MQVSGSLLYETTETVHACGENTEILESLHAFGSVVHSNGGSRQDSFKRITLACAAMNLLSTSIWRRRYVPKGQRSESSNRSCSMSYMAVGDGHYITTWRSE